MQQERIPKSPKPPLRILFIGNSYTYGNDLPGMLAELLVARGRRLEHESVTVGGATLQKHWDDGKALAKLRTHPWDYVVLQEQSTRPLRERPAMEAAVRLFDTQIRKAGAKPLLYLTWAAKADPEEQPKLNVAYESLGHALDCTVVAAGSAWKVATEAGIALYGPDERHPNRAGTYLTACVFYATLAGDSTVGLPRLDIDEKTANALQNIAEKIKGAPWESLFNGKDLTGWRANVMPESFKVVNGMIRAQATRPSSHLFYVGDQKKGFVRFKNFELEVVARSEPNANSGIFFHTDYSVSNSMNHLAKGYEVQLNSTAQEKRKTGSLYDIVDLDKSPVDESKWFTVRIKVEDQRIRVFLNDKPVIDYTEPKNAPRPASRAGRLLDPQGGAIALQGHDPGSVFTFKEIRIRRLAP